MPGPGRWLSQVAPIGSLINYSERSLRQRCVFPPQKVSDRLVNRQWLFVPDRL
jgi:hypothetical protein